MDGSNETPSKPNQHHRRMNSDWFRSPPTDYLNVSTITYPRGSRATLAELEENNPLVDVLYYRNQSRSFVRNGRQPEEWVAQLFVDTDDFQDATTDSTIFSVLGVYGKELIDSIRPAMASVHYPIPDTVSEQHRFYPPFHDLFFAQGRLLETLKHAGLGNAKEKHLRAFLVVVQCVLRKLNHTVRDLSGKRIIDFEHLWTLFPLGSLAVSEVRGMPLICLVIDNPAEPVLPAANGKKHEEKYLPFKFASYGFDGYNFGCYEDRFLFYDFKGHLSLSSLDYRPLKHEERFGDVSVVKRAIERGRKSLDYQNYHHCQYTGKCFKLSSDSRSGKIDVSS